MAKATSLSESIPAGSLPKDTSDGTLEPHAQP